MLGECIDEERWGKAPGVWALITGGLAAFTLELKASDVKNDTSRKWSASAHHQQGFSDCLWLSVGLLPCIIHCSSCLFLLFSLPSLCSPVNMCPIHFSAVEFGVFLLFTKKIMAFFLVIALCHTYRCK